MLLFPCSGCGLTLQAAEALAGKQVKCPRCSRLQPVPAGDIEARGNLDKTLCPPDDGRVSPAYEFLTPPQQPGELGRLGGYRVLRVLGQGGMGVVFHAEDLALQRPVALKVIRPEAAGEQARQRFLREARAAAALEHDHVITVYQVGQERNVPFLAMQLLKGESLESRLRRLGQLTSAEVVRIGREMAEGLAAAHQHGLVHRDIKPDNVWLEGERSRVKLLDFGVARLSTEQATLTNAGAVIGTPAYMAPEQARGEAVGPAGDLFSLGVVLYRCCTGQLPFQARDAVSTLLAVATENPRPIQVLNPQTPAALVKLIVQLLAKNPKERPASAQAVADALHKLEGGTTVPLSVTVPASRPSTTATLVGATLSRPDVRRWWPVAAGAVVLLGCLGLGGAYWLLGVILRVPTSKGTLVLKVDDPQIELDQAWLRELENLPAPQQVIAVANRLKERNPGFDGKVQHTIEGNAVVALELNTDAVANIYPVRALKELRALSCVGSEGRGQLADLSPIKGMQLSTFICLHNPVRDLSALRGAPLKYLAISGTSVDDLSPLAGMPLEALFLVATPVTDLTPLKGMPLKHLECHSTKVRDLAPLHGTPLRDLRINYTDVSDLTPLKGMPLDFFICEHTPVHDLSPLKGMRLTTFACGSTAVTDLSPLRGMSLKFLKCDFDPRRDTEILKSIRTLEMINGKSTAEFWKAVNR